MKTKNKTKSMRRAFFSPTRTMLSQMALPQQIAAGAIKATRKARAKKVVKKTL